VFGGQIIYSLNTLKNIKKDTNQGGLGKIQYSELRNFYAVIDVWSAYIILITTLRGKLNGIQIPQSLKSWMHNIESSFVSNAKWLVLISDFFTAGFLSSEKSSDFTVTFDWTNNFFND
jgi:hypothetical protein